MVVLGEKVASHERGTPVNHQSPPHVGRRLACQLERMVHLEGGGAISYGRVTPLRRNKEQLFVPDRRTLHAAARCLTLNPGPCTMNPAPSTLDLEACTLNPEL